MSVRSPAVALPKKKNKKKCVIAYSVRFHEVQVRVYNRILGDNPACTSGPSMGIGWEYVPQDPRTVDEWEMGRGKGRRPSELMLQRPTREKMLRDLGIGDKEIAAGIRENIKIRSQRRQTVNNLRIQKMEETIENAKRKVNKRLLFLQGKTVDTEY
jgi:hypothetical protein